MDMNLDIQLPDLGGVDLDLDLTLFDIIEGGVGIGTRYTKPRIFKQPAGVHLSQTTPLHGATAQPRRFSRTGIRFPVTIQGWQHQITIQNARVA